MEVCRSAYLFALGVLRRFYVWLPAVVLDPFDLNERVLQPMLPVDWRFQIPWSHDLAPVVLVSLLAWAAILTFHEARKRDAAAPLPDMGIQEVFRYILMKSDWAYKRPVRGGAILLDIDQALRDAALQNRIKVWGRSMSGHRAGQEEFMPELWNTARFDVAACIDGGSPGPPEHVSSHNGLNVTYYTDVACNRSQIRAVFSPKPFWRLRVDQFAHERLQLYHREI